MDIESLEGIAVREELSEENIEFAVCEEAAERTLIWSIDCLGSPDSTVEKES